MFDVRRVRTLTEGSAREPKETRFSERLIALLTQRLLSG
ncbi:hypothetical protein JCM19233_5302 [Vibrio astriarenae]|nr:hypothetical protein JCM19233_5302 [Vibrio sp. C7]